MNGTEYDIVRRIRDAAMDVAREIETGGLVPGKGEMFVPVPGTYDEGAPVPSRPHCALGHVLARAFGSPPLVAGGSPVKKFEQAFRMTVNLAYPKLNTKVRDEVMRLVEGEYTQKVQHWNDYALYQDRDVRRLTCIVEWLRRLAVHCQQIDIDVLPKVDLRTL